MKPVPADKSQKKNGYQSDDDNVRYKLNKEFFNNASKASSKIKKGKAIDEDDDKIRYKFPPAATKPKADNKLKQKSKLKVNFWSNKQSSRLSSDKKPKGNRRHTVGVISDNSLEGKTKHVGVKVRKRVSFLPSPLFSDNHVPMVTVPDDLTIQLNEEEANDLREDLNSAFVNNDACIHDKVNNASKRKSKSQMTSPRGTKRKQSLENVEPKNQINENELEFFSKYVVQKLRRMETNQRIYSENLINTVLMLGQLGKLNGKSKIAEA